MLMHLTRLMGVFRRKEFWQDDYKSPSFNYKMGESPRRGCCGCMGA